MEMEYIKPHENDSLKPLSLDIDMCDWGEGKGPEISIGIESLISFSSCTDSCSVFYSEEHDKAEGFGIYSIPINVLLEDYLQNIVQTDGAEHAKEFAAVLRSYADKFDEI